jgi:putative serine protease PepD
MSDSNDSNDSNDFDELILDPLTQFGVVEGEVEKVDIGDDGQASIESDEAMVPDEFGSVRESGVSDLTENLRERFENEEAAAAVTERTEKVTSDEFKSRNMRRWLSRSLVVTLVTVALLLGGVLIGIYGWEESNDLVIDQPVSNVPEIVVAVAGEEDGSGITPTEVIPTPPDTFEMVEPVSAVAEKVAPSVVRIDTTTGTGSGIILDVTGRVVTNAHVVGGEQVVDIRLADGTRAEGIVLGSDSNVDIAIVQIRNLGATVMTFQAADFASSDTVEVGQLAVAIGSPFGLEQSVTAGIVSAVNRAVRNTNFADGSPTVVEMFQTDAPINPGNSGGALADRQGRVIGMNTSIRTDGIVAGNIGVGFAIPSDTILLVADRIVSGESLDVGFLGISGQNPTLGRPGALVIEVIEGGPAWLGGLISGDLVVAVDGAPILGMSELAAKIRITSPGTSVEIEIVRNGDPVFLAVVIGTLGSN